MLIDKIISELDKCLENVNNQYMNNRICTEEAIDRKVCYETAIDIVKKYSSFESKNNGWIPCSDRLPSDEECSIHWINHPSHRQFICTVNIGDYGPQIRQLYFSDIFGWKYGPEDYNKYVMAWQPLPQPYKGE